MGMVSKASPGQVYLFWGTIQEGTPWRAFIQTLTVYTAQDNRTDEVAAQAVSQEREASWQMKPSFLSFLYPFLSLHQPTKA